jgi:hypothetical protein
MEINFVVALKFHPAELEVTFDIRNIPDIVDLSDTTRQFKIVK